MCDIMPSEHAVNAELSLSRLENNASKQYFLTQNDLPARTTSNLRPELPQEFSPRLCCDFLLLKVKIEGQGRKYHKENA
jgi:hypothetical protein